MFLRESWGTIVVFIQGMDDEEGDRGLFFIFYSFDFLLSFYSLPIHIHWGATYSLAHSFHLFNSTTRSLCWYSARRKDITFRLGLICSGTTISFCTVRIILNTKLYSILCNSFILFTMPMLAKGMSRAKLIKAKYISEFDRNGMINVVQFTDEYPFLVFLAIP